MLALFPMRTFILALTTCVQRITFLQFEDLKSSESRLKLSKPMKPNHKMETKAKLVSKGTRNHN